MTTIVISQPLLFPWPGFFELVALADVYVHLDDVQFPDRSFTNRIQIKQPTGPTWMTVPIRDRTARRLIMDAEGAEGPWRRRHRELIRHALAKAPHLDDALALFDHAYEKRTIVELLIDSIEGPAKYLQLNRPRKIVRSSALGINTKGSQRILDLVLCLGGKRYITAYGAANYLDHEAFERAGVRVEYAEYSKTPYPQLHGPFTPYVSILDTIANLGTSGQAVLRPSSIPWREFLRGREIGQP